MNDSPKQDTDRTDPDTDASRRRGPDWEDPTVPVGNAPDGSRLPLLLWALAWIAWVAFLIAMRFDVAQGPPA